MMWGGRKLIQLRRNRCGDDGGGEIIDMGGLYGGEDLGGDDDDLGGIDQEIGAADWSDDDEDEIGANPSRAMKKAKRKLKRAEKNLEEVELKIARTPFRRKKERLKEKRGEIKTQIKELKAAINRANKSGGRDDGDGGGSADDDSGGNTNNQMRRNMAYDPYGGSSAGVYAGTPPGGKQIEVPLLFNGSNIFEATINGSTVSNTTAAFTADSQAFNYMVLRVTGFKVNAWLAAACVQVSNASIAILDQTNQLAVECQSLVPDGGLDLLANARQTINLGGAFGSASEKTFDGMRSRDTIEQNGTARLTGQIRTVFTTVGAMKFSMEAALICEIVRDFKVDRYAAGVR